MAETLSSKTVVDRGTTFCRECGMHITSESEYHPFAACLMFKACGDPDAVTANPMAVVQHGQEQQRNRRVKKSNDVITVEYDEWYALRADKERLDWLESMARKRGGLLLHSEIEATGRLGLGLAQPHRTLRSAIDQAMEV